MTPAGNPASSATSATMTPAETGANSDGFTTTVFPAATGEMTARHDRMLAPFHGGKLAPTPSGPTPGAAAGRQSNESRVGLLPDPRREADRPTRRPAAGSLQLDPSGTWRTR